MSEPLAVLKTAMDMYQAQYTATDKLWAYFSTVSLALVAYTISSDKVTRGLPEISAAVGAYVVFCFGNFWALRASQTQLVALAEVVRSKAKAENVDLASFSPFSAYEVGAFYWLVVIAIGVASVALAWHRGGARTNSGPK
jgi:hypothetical protein